MDLSGLLWASLPYDHALDKIKNLDRQSTANDYETRRKAPRMSLHQSNQARLNLLCGCTYYFSPPLTRISTERQNVAQVFIARLTQTD